MSYLGVNHQPGRFPAEHLFRDGLNADLAPESTPKTVYTSAGNFHLLRQQGSELILASDRGTLRKCQLPENTVVLGYASRDGILYLVLAEVLDGAATGKGQVGCFPSPEYEEDGGQLVPEGYLIDEYHQLRVFQPDGTGLPVGLESVLFDFDLTEPVEVYIQPSYDGSVNLLVHNRGRTSPLLINSGWTRKGDAGFRLLERTGQVQTNRYKNADFSGRLQQQLRPQTAAKLLLVEVPEGGRLPGGEYNYYLQYADADGNVTGVAAEVGPVQVFNQAGGVPAQTEGALPGAATTRRVKLRATGLDPQLGYVRISYVRRSGEPLAATTSARLAERFAVPVNGTLELLHTGFEDETAVPIEELLPLANRVDSYRTATPVEQGRLLTAGISSAAGNESILEQLRTFTRSCRLTSGYATLDDPMLKSSTTNTGQPDNLFQTFSQQQSSSDGWLGGYANPLNICFRLGYHDAEAYCWGAQYLLLDGTITDVFFPEGIDNLDGLTSYTNNATYDEQGWSADRKQNRAGVFRFPRRNIVGQKPPLGSNGTLNVLRGGLLLAAIPQALRDQVRAVRYVRAPRRANRMLQGLIVPTLRVLATPPGGDQEYDQHHGDMGNVLTGDITNLKVLPAPYMTIEAALSMNGRDENKRRGVYPFHFWRRTNHPQKGLQSLQDPLRYALYAPELWAEASTLRTQMNGTASKIVFSQIMQARRQHKYTNYFGGGSWTLYHPTAMTGLGKAVQAAKLYWTLDNQGLVNPGKFASQEGHVRGKHVNDDKFLVRSSWEEYVGVLFTAAVDSANALGLPDTGKNTGYEDYSSVNNSGYFTDTFPLGFVVDVYGAEGVWDSETLRSAYASDSVAFQPVTQWLTWEELENSLVGSRELPLFGGDAYLSSSMRRINRSMSQEQLGDTPENLSQAVIMCTSSNVNPWLRSMDGQKSFPPKIAAETSDIGQLRGSTYRVLAETTRYNAGYTRPSYTSPPLVVSTRERGTSVPFSRYWFPQRVWATSASADTMLTNGWRNFPALLFRDYDIGAGEIMRLLGGPGGLVLIVYERGLATIQLNERALAGKQGSDMIYTQALGLLPEKPTTIATDLGLQHAFGITASDVAVYGYDALQNCVWRYQWGAQKAERLSDQRVNTLLTPASEAVKGRPIEILQTDVRLTYEAKRGDVLVNIYRNVGGAGYAYTSAASVTLAYNEPLNLWITEHTHRAQIHMPFEGQHVLSLPLPGVSGDAPTQRFLWQHNVGPAATTGPYAGLRLYDKLHPVWVEVMVLGSGPETIKHVDNLVLISSNELPTQLSITSAEQGSFTQALVEGGEGREHLMTVERQEQITYVQVVTPEDAPWGGRIRAQWTRLRLTFTGKNTLRLSKLVVLLRESLT
jgi:hypothetical protein